MSTEFDRALERALEALNESGVAGPLGELSSPTREEVQHFVERLQGEQVERKRDLLAAMVQAAEDSFELDFDDLFRPFLHDPDATIRRHAIEGLWETERADLVRPMIEFLGSDPDALVRAAAALSLGRLLWLVECDELPAHLGVQIERALRKAFENPAEDIEVRRRALEAIAYVNEDWVRGMIDRAYEHEDERMRVSALFAMGRNADVFWTETVLAELDNDAAAIRFEAARASGEMQLRRAVQRLIGMVEDPDAEVQEMAIWALGQIGGKRARAALEHYASSEDEARSDAATAALGEIEFASRPFELLAVDPAQETLGEFRLADEDLDDEGLDEEEDEDDTYWRDDALDLT